MVKHYQEDTIKEILEEAQKTLPHREIAERMGKNLPAIYFAIRRTFAEGSFGYAGSGREDERCVRSHRQDHVEKNRDLIVPRKFPSRDNP